MGKYIKSSIQGAFIGLIVFLSYEGAKVLFKKPTAITTPEPCICPTYEEIASWTASYEVFNDSLNYGRKSDKSRYQDSVNKFKLILKIK